MLDNEADFNPEPTGKTLAEKFPHIHSDLLLGGIATTVVGVAVFRIGASTEYLPSLRTIGSLSTMAGLSSFLGETYRSVNQSFNQTPKSDPTEIET